MEAIIKPLQTVIEKLQSDFLDQTQQIKMVSQELTALKQDSINHTSVIPIPQILPPPTTHFPSPDRALPQTNPVSTTKPVSSSVVVNDAANAPYVLQSTMQQGVPDQGSFGPTDLFMTGGDISRRFSGRIPVKLEFPTFGRKEDDPDPLIYIEKCRDYLALNPLSNEELTATLRNVLHGTARDWWDVARFSISTWVEFQTSFLSAFLSEDYVDELAERIRNRVQGENESIRDFAYMYYSLCRRWKPEITEEEVIKLILKNINPSIASELRRRVSTVDELVRLGQQLEKDKQNQQQYEQRKRFSNKMTGKPECQNQQIVAKKEQEKGSLVFCWKCKGSHSPASCRHYPSSKNKDMSKNSNASNSGHQSQPTVSTVIQQNGSEIKDQHVGKHKRDRVPLLATGDTSPSQLMVSLVIRQWQGDAIVDTGSSFTLLSEKLWTSVKLPGEEMQEWVEGPLYLANGKAKHPLGWTEMEVQINNRNWVVPVVIMSEEMLVFSVILGLDFLFYSGLQIDVTTNTYWFKPNEKQRFSFNGGSQKLNDWGLERPVALYTAIPPTPTVPSFEAELADLVEKAVQHAQLEEEGKRMLLEQLQQNSDVCSTKLGHTKLLSHQIFLTQEVPVKQKPYRVSPAKLKAMKELIDEMLAAEVIEPSSSAWASPVVLIPKKTGGLRFCVDYRKLNAVTQSDAYPLPNIQEILESLVGASIFTSLDLNSGYWQVHMAPDSQDKTAFVCSFGLFHFKTMPFGLKNAPSTFQRLMERVLGDLRGKVCLVYLDDIIIFSPNKDQHFQDLQLVLNKLREAGLTVNMKKSKFFQSTLKFLGHIVSEEGIQVDSEKTQAIRDFPIPPNLKSLQRFLGMAGWYHRFVPNFSQIAEPLTALKRKGARFKWTAACQDAFDNLKQHLMESPILGHPDFNLPLVVYTDSSDVGLGAVLCQQRRPGTEEVLAYASRTLNRAERNYSTTEQECLAVVWALEKWRYYLEGRYFTVVTDHSSLKWVFKTNKPSTRLMRWALRLQEFTFAVEYRRGKYNLVPDALSRIPSDQSNLSTCAAVLKPTKKEPPATVFPLTDEEIWRAQQDDQEVQEIYQSILEDGEKIINSVTKLTIIEDKVYRVVQLPHCSLYQVWIPGPLRSRLMSFFHDDPLSGHLGRYKTYRRLQALVYWPKMSQDVKAYVTRCQTCQCYKPESKKPAGPQFVSETFSETCKGWNSTQKFTTAYHPQTNFTERVNRTLKTMVACYVGSHHHQWDQHLHEFRFALNSSVQESTGVTPAELNLNRLLRGPLDMVLQPQDVAPDTAIYNNIVQLQDLKGLVEKNLYRARLRQKRNYDRKRRELSFRTNDRVWIRSHPLSKAEKKFSAKLAPKWQGPYRIVRRMGPLTYQVVQEKTGEDLRVIHISQLKTCYPTAQQLDEIQHRQLVEIFKEEDADEEFLGFSENDLKTDEEKTDSAY
ncbi:Retrovirus-related Pol polyprotein from transposon 17.6 [Labeo rohita]|uniref:Gypsy retrotransposon integrase-like protein 1 n=1 Tax=Labeo rohita TaxID=84645 RepID=A0ABQ8LBU1_LABRO|nr:Retrovirus-related Pol polyprotein from transposon 17.6 [Labeo rohita]